MAAGVLLPGGVLSMTSSAAERLVRSGSGDAALLYLQLLRQGGQFDAEGVRKALGWSADRVAAAYGQLSDLGLARKDADLSPAPAPPELSPSRSATFAAPAASASPGHTTRRIPNGRFP